MKENKICPNALKIHIFLHYWIRSPPTLQRQRNPLNFQLSCGNQPPLPPCGRRPSLSSSTIRYSSHLMDSVALHWTTFNSPSYPFIRLEFIKLWFLSYFFAANSITTVAEWKCKFCWKRLTGVSGDVLIYYYQFLHPFLLDCFSSSYSGFQEWNFSIFGGFRGIYLHNC